MTLKPKKGPKREKAEKTPKVLLRARKMSMKFS